MTTRVLTLLCALLFARSLSAAPYKPQCRDASGKLAQCVGTLDLTQVPSAIPATSIAAGLVSNTEFGYLDGVTSAIQTQIDAVNAALANFVALTGPQTIGGVKTFTSPPVFSGASITSGTVPPSSIQGGTSGRVLVDTGTTGAFTNTPVGLTLSGASNTFTNIPANTALVNRVLVANGGTDKASWAVGAIPVATGVTTIGEIAPGTAGQVLTSNGAGSPPSMQAPVTSNTASASAGTSQTLTNNAYTAVTGASVSLAAGSYLCAANVRTAVQCSAGAGYISLKLYNVTGAADIANSERIGAVCATTGTAYSATTPITELVTVGSTSTIQIYAVSPAGATYTSRDIYSDSDGRTRLVCVKTAP